MEDPAVDRTSKFYISQSLFYIHHDLADERNPILRVQHVAGTLNDDHFYQAVYTDKPNTTVKKLKALGKTAKKLLDLCAR